MNNDIVIITDSHIGARSFNKKVFENQMRFFDEQLFPYLIENEIKEVIHLGDLVHNRNTIDLWILQEFKIRVFKRLEDLGIRIHLEDLLRKPKFYFRNFSDYVT